MCKAGRKEVEEPMKGTMTRSIFKIIETISIETERETVTGETGIEVEIEAEMKIFRIMIIVITMTVQ